MVAYFRFVGRIALRVGACLLGVEGMVDSAGREV